MERSAPETARKSLTSFSLNMIQPRSSSPSSSSSATEDTDGGVHVCEVCGGCFETKRGLSSHCRSHLRQLGVSVSDSSGAPIHLLYQLITQRDGKLPFSSSSHKTASHKPPKTHKTPNTPSTKSPQSLTTNPTQSLTITTPKPPQSPILKSPQSLTTKTPQKTKTPKTPKTLSSKKNSSAKLKIKISALVKKYSKSPALTLPSQTPSSTPLSRPPLKPKKKIPKSPAELKKVPVPVSPSLSPSLTSSKPLWAPQETDAPLNLTAMTDSCQRDDVHVCELCGAWYETRKGLSSHARAHLRQFGVEIDSKGSPIDILHELLQKEEHQDNLPPSSALKRPKRSAPPSPAAEEKTSTLISPPPAKKLKTTKTPHKGDLLKGIRCEFCHEKFKKSQSLASHARSHLRQLGVTEWTVQGSPMATLRDLMTRRGVTSLPKPHAPPSLFPKEQHTSPTMPQAPPIQASATPTKHQTLSTEPHAPPTKTGALSVKPVTSPTNPLLSIATPPITTAPPPAAAPNTPSLGSAPPRVPKARKGSRTVVPKPKDEPVERDISIIEPPKIKSSTTASLTGPVSNPDKTNTVVKVEVDTCALVRCDFCSEVFESRKALSCHARAHLRQLGVTWSQNASPIDTLYRLMIRDQTSTCQSLTSSPVHLSREKADPLDSTATGSEATCELCGFDFENRKALASHARAHLRQQGVHWHTNGSPIETLAEWMRTQPHKVAELHRRYMHGELPVVVKRRTSTSSPHLSLSELELTRPPPAREVKSHPSTSSAHRKPSAYQHTATHSSARGCERRPLKHLPHSESRLGVEPVKRVGNAPSLMPRPPENSLVKLVGKIYSLKCRFCEEVFKGPVSVQEDWLIHLRQHILNLKQDSAHNSSLNSAPTVPHTDTVQLIGPEAV